MKDISILIIKPEVIKKREEIKKELEKRGYKIINEKKLDGWKNLAKEIYNEFSSVEIKQYLLGYDKHKFKDKFAVLILKNNEGNTLKRLKEEQGDFLNYQKENENTLRAKFGLPKEYNLKYGKTIFTYTGIHCPKNEKELNSQLKMFKLLNYKNLTI